MIYDPFFRGCQFDYSSCIKHIFSSVWCHAAFQKDYSVIIKERSCRQAKNRTVNAACLLVDKNTDMYISDIWIFWKNSKLFCHKFSESETPISHRLITRRVKYFMPSFLEITDKENLFSWFGLVGQMSTKQSLPLLHKLRKAHRLYV